MPLIDRAGVAVRPPPLRDLIGFGPGAPHELARRVDDALDHDLPIRVVRLISGHAVFLSSWLSATSANGRRGGRSVPPRACGTRRASRRLPSAARVRAGTAETAPSARAR